MNKKIKELWIEHLKSDWYEQNLIDDEVPLRTSDNRWSAFGILCNIHAQEHPDVASLQPSETHYCDRMYVIPHHVAIWAGLTHRNDVYNSDIFFPKPIHLFGKTFFSVIEMQDAHVPNFMIADMIDIYL
jgi:hypothetical protein